MITHIHISVRRALKWPDEQLEGFFQDTDTKQVLTVAEARAYLTACLQDGKEVIPLGKCNNFDYLTGCKGHPSKHDK